MLTYWRFQYAQCTVLNFKVITYVESTPKKSLRSSYGLTTPFIPISLCFGVIVYAITI